MYVGQVFGNYFEMVPVTPLITGIAFVFTFYTCCMSTVKFSASFLITSPEIATSININVPLSLSVILMSGLLLELGLSVCTC
jgi:hypothetical protein